MQPDFSILDYHPNGQFVLDADSRIVFWNRCMELWSLQKADDVVGQVVFNVLSAMDRPIMRKRLAELFQRGTPLVFAPHLHGDMYGFKRQDGAVRVHHTVAAPVPAPGGGYWALLTLQDVSDMTRALQGVSKARKEAESLNRELAVTTARAEAASIAKGEFLANMSHEIRTPMNGVVSMTELLFETDLSDEQREYVEIIQSSGRTLLSLINDILDFSKIEARKLELQSVEFDLQEVVSKVMDTFSVRARENATQLICDMDPTVEVVRIGDPLRLRQILSNLLDNALKFTVAGSVTIQVTAFDSESRVRFVVMDTGIGIPHDKQDRLFRHFSQVDGSVTRKYGGSGLGLAIAKQLVDLMDGEIGVHSEPGKGSEFWFVLPLSARSQEPVAEQISATSAAPIKPKDARILLVEDNPVNQQVALLVLNKLGFKGVPVDDGVAALKALSAAPFDLVLMDMQMPHMDGLTATREWRKREQANPEKPSRLPIIAMTANAMTGDREKCLEAGMDDYLAKPVDPKALSAMLSKWLANDAEPATTATC
jgi:PAS domain S-box-containing protein